MSHDPSGDTFTTEAVRDAAIPNPYEGMRAYLTAPTVPAATGGTVSVPSGVQTIYNGTSWVCVTPVGAYTANVGTSSGAGYTTTLGGSPGTNPTVTLVTGTTALVSTSAYVSTISTGVSLMSVSVSGAGTVAASNYGLAGTNTGAGQAFTVARTFVFSGLTAGTNTFALNYDAQGSASQWEFRSITVQGIA